MLQSHCIGGVRQVKYKFVDKLNKARRRIDIRNNLLNNQLLENEAQSINDIKIPCDFKNNLINNNEINDVIMKRKSIIKSNRRSKLSIKKNIQSKTVSDLNYFKEVKFSGTESDLIQTIQENNVSQKMKNISDNIKYKIKPNYFKNETTTEYHKSPEVDRMKTIYHNNDNQYKNVEFYNIGEIINRKND